MMNESQSRRAGEHGFRRDARLPAGRSVFLFGPRQTGKSTFVRTHLPAEALTYDLLRTETYLRLSRNPASLRAEVLAWLRTARPEGRVVFIDEVQKLPALLDEVHGLIEETGLRFILTGSSARKLRRGGANLLAGRAATRFMHPLTQNEMGERFDLERALRFGTLPPVATGDDAAARDLLAAYADTYLREEIQAEALVRNLGGFARFLDVVAAQPGELLNVSALARDAGVAARTVTDYVSILEDTLIATRLEAWRRSPRARMTLHPKLYLFDPGIVNALCHRLSAPPDPVWRGRLFETWVVNECRRLIDYRQSEARLFYWRTHAGAEVDLLIERHGALRLAVEVKSGTRVDTSDLRGLRAFAEVHPEVPRVVVAPVERAMELVSARVLPVGAFLAEVNAALGG